MKVYVVMQVSKRSFTGTFILAIMRDEDAAIEEAAKAEKKRKKRDPTNETMIVIRPEKVR